MSDDRGLPVAGTRIHSIRLPGYSLSTEVVFGAPGERLSLRHDPGDSPDPYVGGTLLAVRNASSVRGVVRGIDAWLPQLAREREHAPIPGAVQQ
jgi:4-hydroxy-tetrahydrodipicolinate reductase